MNEPVNSYYALSLWECNGFWVYSLDGHSQNATFMGIKFTKSRKITFICPEDVEEPGGILFESGESPPRK